VGVRWVRWGGVQGADLGARDGKSWGGTAAVNGRQGSLWPGRRQQQSRNRPSRNCPGLAELQPKKMDACSSKRGERTLNLEATIQAGAN